MKVWGGVTYNSTYKTTFLNKTKSIVYKPCGSV